MKLTNNYSRVLLVFLASLTNVAGTVAIGQAPGNAPPLLYPLNKLPTDVEIVVALAGTDEALKEVIIERAKALPQRSLSASTVKAIGDEVIKVTQDKQRRFKKEPWNVTEETSRSEYIVGLAQVLMTQRNVAGIDGLSVVVARGAPGGALVEFGETAVPALIKVAATEPEDEVGNAFSAMDALEQMLESPVIRPTLSTSSMAAIRQVAAQRLRSTRENDNWRTLASAAYLAVATRDVLLRKEVSDLLDNDGEFVRRGIDAEWQQEFAATTRQALGKTFP